MKFSACVSVAALVAAGALPPHAVAQQVGTVAAVNRDMTGTPPGQMRRDLALGLDIIRNERVETTDIGSGQLMFLDQTTLTVSPNSDIVLDEYVYDPAAGTSDLALSVTRGALRFIGGRITKAGPAIVRTPTATVGIRGGLAVIDIRPDGVTDVIHLAGEYTTVSQCGDADGNGIDDGCAPEDVRSRVVLSRPNASASASATGVEYTGLADANRLAGIYGKLEGQGQGGVERAPSDEEVAAGTAGLAAANSDVPGGENKQPVSTSGEVLAPPTGQSEESIDLITIVQTDDPTVGGQPGDTDPPTGGGGGGGGTPLVPEGGAAFTGELGFLPFDTVEAGSLIGRSGDEAFVFPVPASPSQLLRTHPLGAGFTPRAVALHPGAGLFPFGPESASSTSLGPLRGEFADEAGNGVGLADFDNDFVFVPFVNGGPGIAMFGTPTPGQGRFFAGDPDLTGAQTVDAYHNEFGLDLGRSFLFIGSGSRTPVPEHLFIVGKSGEPRFLLDSPPVVVDGELPADESPISGGLPGRAVAAGIDFASGEDGSAERLAIFVEPLRSSQATLAPEMTITGQGFVTLNENGTFAFGEPAYGTFEDLRGHTLFGPTGEYFVLSSVHRSGPDTLETDEFGTDLVLLDGNSPGGSFEPFPPSFRASLFARDATRAEIIADPLPLASEPGLGDFGTAARLSGGFAAGIAICSSGNCGDRSDFFEAPDFAGGYPLFSDPGPFGTSIGFDPDGPGMGFTFAVTDDDGASNIAGAGDLSDPTSFVFHVGQNGPTGSGDAFGAYLDDRRFAAVGTGPQLIAGSGHDATVGLASSGLAGTGEGTLFAPGTDVQPEYLRWGYWSATYQVPDGTTGQTRTDLVPVGTFVAGNLPDAIPFAGSASYSGFAVATAADIATTATRTIGGSFTMNYDFGQSHGNVEINLPTFAVPHVTLDVFGGETNFYAGSITSEVPGGLEADVRGAFFAGGGDPVAATAGNFAIEQGNDFAIGVYGGTSSGFVPGETQALAASN